MRLAVTAAMLALFAISCAEATPGDQDLPAPATSEAATETASAASSPATTTTLSAVEEPTTPLFSGQAGDSWYRAWAELDIETLAGFFADGAIVNGTLFDNAMREAVARHPDPIGWSETFEDCIYRTSRYATCDAAWTSAVHSPAGLEVPVHRSVYFDDDGLISLYRDDVQLEAIIEFEVAIAEWLAEYHPEIRPIDWEGDGYESYAESVSGVLAVVDEFVAWSNEYPPAEPVVDDPVLSGTVDGVDVYNATDEQISMVAWAIRRFAASGLEPPPVTHVTFPPTVACERGFSGMSFHSATSGHIEVCATAEALAAASGAAPLTARRTILHELGHLWTAARTDQDVRRMFMDHLGLEAWTGVDWGDSGSEMAAEILMWGLMDEPVGVRVPGASCPDRATAFELLTGMPPQMRSC